LKKTQLLQKEKKIVGLKLRTNNKTEENPLEGKIFPCIKKYFHENIAALIPNRLNPDTTYCIYTEYESDHHGDYTYYIGEEVSSFSATPAGSGLERLIIPSQKYVRFTNGPGTMPDVVRKPWQEIWQMSPKDFGGERRYLADFEVYDKRSSDHQKIILDIYIGIQ
jgi:predicted transcriptional regulator YdeE